jgi:hypothetical protein
MGASKSGGCGCLTLIIAIIGIGVLVHGSSDSNSGANPTPSNSKPVPDILESKPAEPMLSPEQLMDGATLDTKYEIDADAHCDSQADDYLRSVAKYDFKWDNVGFLDPKFDKYLKHVSAPGVLTLVTDKVMLQNGFGAYERTTLTCDYDTQARAVLRFHLITDE